LITTPQGYYNPSASLFIPSGESIVKALFSRGFHYQYDYLSVLGLLVVYLPVSAYANGIACSTGIVIPCLMNGALIGRLFGLLMTDMLGVSDDPSRQWVDPGAFALIGAAGFFAGVARITMALTVIMTEISNDTHFILPIMTAIMVGKWTADATGVHPIYHALMDKKCFPYLQPVPHAHLPMECFAAGQVAVRKVACVPLEITVANLAKLLREFKHNAFPCTVPGPSGDGQDGQFVGIVLREHLVALTQNPNLWNGSKKAQALKKKMDEIFDLIDENGDGELDLDEVVLAARRGQISGMNEQEAVALFKEVDTKHAGTLNRADVSMNTDQLEAMELKAFDCPEELSSKELDVSLEHLSQAPISGKFTVDLRPCVDCSAFTVAETFSLAHAYSLFRSMGLRHLVVVDAFNSVAGMITRHNLMDANLNACCTVDNMKSPEDLLDHMISAVEGE
jgi:chloride channel 7